MTELKERLPSINEAMENAIYERFIDVTNTKGIQNKEYIEENNKAIELQDKILSLISGDLETLFDDYACAHAIADSTMAKICYRQGLIDGMGILKAWRR